MKKLSVVFLIVLFTSSGWGATYYVRDGGGSYGAEDGSTYANAFDGFADVSGLVAGDVLYICGTINRSSSWWPDFDGTATSRIVFDGDCYNGATPDPGIIDGGSNQIHLIALGTDDYIEIRNLTIRNWQGHAAGASLYCGIKVEDSLGVYIHDNTIFSDGSGAAIGIYVLGASDNGIISNNEIHTAFEGIRFDDKSTVVANDFLITGNTVHDIKLYQPPNADCIQFLGTAGTNDYSGTVISNNTLYACADHGIDTCGGTNIDIIGNTIRDITAADGGDAGGMKLNCDVNESLINVYDNLIYNIEGGTASIGILVIKAYGTITNNTFKNIDRHCINASSAVTSHRYIYNNLMTDCGDLTPTTCLSTTDDAYQHVYNNLFNDCANKVSNIGDGTVAGLNSTHTDAASNIGGDPLLDANYHIPSTSPARDTGDDSVVHATRIICGSAVDIGYWEFCPKITAIGR
jgi:hypothetical protein